MKISIEQYERIIHFLDGDMPLEQMELFQKELEGNPEMRRQLDFEQAVRDSFYFKQQLAQTVEPSGLTSVKPRSNIVRSKWLAVAIAASVIGVVVTVALLTPSVKTETAVAKNDSIIIGPKKNDTLQSSVANSSGQSESKVLAGLFQQYFTMDALPDNYPLVLADAFEGYEKGDYKKLIRLNVSELPETRGAEDRDATIRLGRYYKGLAFLKTADTKHAIKQLQLVAAISDSEPSPAKVKWYLALAYLKDNDITQANVLLQELMAESADKIIKQKAVQLLQQLK